MGYFPLSGQHYLLQGTNPYGYDLNGIFGLKIKRFDILLRFNHLQKLWDNQLQEFVQDYPIYDFNFRFGLRWLIRG